MDALQKESTQLKDALLTQIDAIKCAETRLENRTYRPGSEICRDKSEIGLGDEVLQLHQTKEDLIRRINYTKLVFNI